MTKHNSHFTGELGQRFGYRKLTIGLCSVVLGSFLLTANNQQVKADVVADNKTQSETSSSSTGEKNNEEVESANVVKETAPAEKSDSLNKVTIDNTENNNVTLSQSQTGQQTYQPAVTNTNQSSRISVNNTQQTNTSTEIKNTQQNVNQSVLSKQNAVINQPNTIQNTTDVQTDKMRVNNTQTVNTNNNDIKSTTTSTLDLKEQNSGVYVLASLLDSKTDTLKTEDKSDTSKEKTESGLLAYTQSTTDIVPEKYKMVHHNAKTHNVYHPAETHDVYHPAETHQEYVEGNSYTIHHDAITHVETHFRSSSGVDYNRDVPGYDNSREAGDTGHYYNVTVVDQPAWDETVQDPGYYTTVTDRDAWTETVTDRPAWNETVVDKAAYDEKVVTQPGYSNQNLAIDVVDVDPSLDSAHMGQQLGKAVIITGKIGDSKTLDASTITIPKGYKLAPGQSQTPTITFKNSTDPYLFKLVHIIDTTPLKPGDLVNDKDPNGDKLKDTDFTTDLNRTIHVENEPGVNNHDIHQRVVFTRQGFRDEATGLVKWNDYELNTDLTTSKNNVFSAYVPTVHTGYTSHVDGTDKAAVDAITDVTGFTKQSTIKDATVTYTADAQTVTIKLIDTDDNSRTLNTFTKNGVTDQIVDLSDINLPANYELAQGQTAIPASYKLTADKNQVISINVAHQIAKTPVEDGVPSDNLDRTFTRNITITNEPNQPAVQTITQSVHFHHVGYRDLVTGNINWVRWDVVDGNQDFNSITPNSYTGYTSHIDNGSNIVESLTITADSKQSDIKDVKINYTANPQSITYHFLDQDENNQEVQGSAITENGVTDQTKSFTLMLPKGYDLASGQNLPTSYKFLAENNLPVNIYVVHHIDNEDLKSGDLIDKNNPNQGTLKDTDFNRDFKRTITIQDEPYSASPTRTVTQEVYYSRTGHRDEATGLVRWSNWQINSALTNSNNNLPQLDAFIPASYDGYSVIIDGNDNIKQIDAITVNVDTDINTIKNHTVNYVANPQSITFTWIDDDAQGKPIKTVTEHGVTDQHITFSDTNRPAGYDLAEGSIDAPNEYTFKAKDNTFKAIHLKHHVDSNAVKEGDTDGHGGVVKKSDYDRNLMRTITFDNEPHADGDPNRIINQNIHFTRVGHFDHALNKIIWTPWTVEPNGTTSVSKQAKFDKIDLPQHAGYTLLVDGQNGIMSIPEQGGFNQDTPQSSVHNYKISYTANPQSITYSFVDDDDLQNTVGTITENGVTDQTVHFTNVIVPDGYTLADGEKLPTEYTFKGANNTANPIHVKHRIDTPSDMTQRDPDNGNKTLAELTDVKRNYVFNANVPDKYLDDAQKSVSWNLHFHRSVGQDAITKKYIYGSWQLDGNNKFNEKTNANIDSPSMSAFMTTDSLPPNDIYGYRVFITQKNSKGEKVDPTLFTDHAQDDVGKTKVHYSINASSPLDLLDNFTQTFNWVPNTANAMVRYVDNKTGQVVASDNNVISGAIDSSAKYEVNAPSGYNLHHIGQTITRQDANSNSGLMILATDEANEVNLGTTMPEVSFNTTKDKNGNWGLDLPSYTVYLSHKVDQLKPGEHGTIDSDFNRHVERDITINTPDGKQSKQKQEYTFTRTGQYDEVTKQVTFTPWSNNGEYKFDSVTIPKIDGYESSGLVPEMTITPDSSPNSTLDITYKALGQNVTINYVDGATGKVQKSLVVTGKTGDQIDLGINKNMPTNWQNDGDIQDSYTFNSDKDQTVNVKIRHQMVAEPDDKRDVTRTIKVTLPDGTLDKEHSVTQTASFSRTTKFDKVLGRNVYGAWSENKNFDAINLPDIAGYKTPIIPSSIVTPDTSSSTLNLSYTANDQNVSIFYIDENGNRIKTSTVIGKTDQTLPINYEVPVNWHIASGAVDNYTFKSKDNTPITVTIAHNTKALNDENRIIDRLVEIDKPGQAPKTVKQTAMFTRHTYQDLVDGQTIYGDWNNGGKYTFDAVKIDPVDGYAVNGSANSVVVTPDTNSTDLNTKITYIAGGQNSSYYFVDDDEGGKKVGDSVVIAGKTDTTVKLDVKAPTNYVFSTDYTVPGSYSFKANGNNPLVIHVKHATTDASSDKTAETSRTITRNITITDPTGKAVNAQQSLTFKRSAIKDLVTGAYTYGHWNNDGRGQFAEYPVKNIDGYKVIDKDTGKEISKINTMTVDADKTAKVSNVNVGYRAENQSTYWMFVDDDADNGADVTGLEQHHAINGVTDQDVKLDINLPKNYYIATIGDKQADKKGVNLPSSYKLKASANVPLVIHLKHALQSVSTNNGDKGIDDTRTITRTIIITNPQGKDTKEEQSVTFTRDANKDLVTGKILYGNWSNGGKQKLDELDVPSIPGYSSDNKIPAIWVTPNSKPSSLSVHYLANDGQQTISYVDNKGNEIGKQVVKGKTDQEIKVDPNVPDGWKGKVPDKITIPAEDKPIKVTIDHVHVIVTPDKPGAPGSVIPGTRTKVFPKGTGIEDLTKDVSRTVTITTPDGKSQTTTQTVKFGRTADIDVVTGDITYTDWTPKGKDNFDPITIPTVPGCTPSQTEVPGVKNVPSDFKDKGGKDITITYNHNDGQQTIIYQDKDGKELGKQIIKGKVFDDVQLTPEFPKGYTNKNMPKTIKIPEVDKPITFEVDRIITKVHIDSDHPLNEGDIIPETDVKAPKGLSKDDLNKDITRTITIIMPDGQSNVTKQTVHAKRGATIDLDTKKITYDPWQIVDKDSFDPVDVPKIDGYKPNMDQVPGVEHVDPNKDYGNDLNIQVTYTKQAEKNTGDYGNGGGIVDNSINTDSTINGDGQLRDITWNGMNNNNVSIKLDSKANRNGKHRKSSKLSSALLKNGKHGKRDYGNNSYVNSYGSGYSYNNQYGTGYSNGYSNGYGYNSANIVDSSSQSNNLSSGLSASSVATGQYGNKDLPQTGTTQSLAVIAIGLATVALSFGLAGTRRKRRD